VRLNSKTTLTALALAVCALASAPGAYACSCVPTPPPCEAFRNAPAVFTATVTEITTETITFEGSEGIKPHQIPVARLSVGRAFKGVAEKEVRMWQGTGDGDCSFVFEKGETYLLYATYDEETKLYGTNTCTRSRPVAYAADDLDYLRGLPGSDATTRLSGMLARIDYSDDGNQTPALLGGVKVVAEDAQGRRFEATTDAEGLYKITGLPAGRYKVRPELPSHLSLAYGYLDEVEVPAGGCAGVSFLARTDGRISGTLIDAEGRPVAETYVDLVPAEHADRVNDRKVGRFKKTDGDGRFEFAELTAGTYLLGINIRQEPSGGQPFPRTYFPGVGSAAEAQSIKLENGQKFSDLVLHLPPRLPVRAVEGVLVWPDGKPVTKALVLFTDTPDPTGGETLGMANVNEQGRFSIPALEGQAGWVHAPVFAPSKEGLDAVASNPVRVVAGARQKPVRLVAGRKTGGGVRIIR
jgi:hypothetical protein